MESSAGRRNNTSLVQPYERPVLHWLARHTPLWVSPNHLTGLGLAGAIVASLGYVLSNISDAYLWLASAGLVLNWLGDSLDGTLARFRQIERPRFGLYIDHTTDLASQIFLLLGLGLSPYIRFEVACLALVAYLAFMVVAFLRRIVFGVLDISYAGIGPTELRLGLLFLNLMIVLIPPWTVVARPSISSADLGVLTVVVPIVILLIATVIADASRIAREDPAVGKQRAGSATAGER